MLSNSPAGAAGPGTEHETIPRGSRLGGGARLGLVSYNLLAPMYVRPVDKRAGGVPAFAAFGWAEPAGEVLAWEKRWPRLLAEIEAAGADVVCLQEVQFELDGPGGQFGLPHWLRPLTVAGGGRYEALLPSQTGLIQMAKRNKDVLGVYAPHGNALLVDCSRLELIDPQDAAAAKVNGKGKVKGKDKESSTSTRVAALVRGRVGTPLAGKLGLTAIFSVHLDATNENQRVSGLRRCLRQARQLGTREVVIAGDFNAELRLGSCIAALVSGDPEASAADMAKECAAARPPDAPAVPSPDQVEAEMEMWKALHAEAAAVSRDTRIKVMRAPTRGTRAAWDLSTSQTSGPCSDSALDHILYTPRTLRLAELWETLEADPESVARGLPNARCPSDHLPVACSFDMELAPQLPDEGRAAVRSKWDAVTCQHRAEIARLEADLDAEKAATAEAAGISPEDMKGKKPPPAMIKCLQNRRARLKELRRKHSQELEELTAGFSELELDAAEHMGLGTSTL